MENAKNCEAWEVEVEYSASKQHSDTLSTDVLTPRDNGDTERSVFRGIHENVRNLAICSFVLVALVSHANAMTKGSNNPTSREREEAAKRQQLQEAANRRAAEKRVRDDRAARAAAREARRP